MKTHYRLLEMPVLANCTLSRRTRALPLADSMRGSWCRFTVVAALLAAALLAMPARGEQIVNLSLRDFNREADQELAPLRRDIDNRNQEVQESRTLVGRTYEEMQNKEGSDAYTRARAEWLAALGTHIKNRSDLWQAKLEAAGKRYSQHQGYIAQLRERLSSLDQEQTQMLAGEAHAERARIRRELQAFADELASEAGTDVALLREAGLSDQALGSLEGLGGLLAQVRAEAGVARPGDAEETPTLDERAPVKTVMAAAEAQQRELFIRYHVLRSAISANKQVAARVLHLITEADLRDGTSNPRHFGVQDLKNDV